MNDNKLTVNKGEVPQFEAHNLFGVLGFAFFLGWVISVLTHPLLFVGLPEQADTLLSRGVFLAASLLMLGICIVISSFSLMNKWLSCFFVVLIPCAPLAGILGYFFDLLTHTLWVFWFVSGLGTSVLLVLWCTFLSTLQHSRAILYPALSVGIATLLIIFSEFLIDVPAACFLFSFPLVSFVLCILERRSRSYRHKITFFEEYQIGEKHRPSLRQITLWRSALSTLCNSMCLGFAFYYMAIIGSAGEAVIICHAAVLAACLLRGLDYLHHRMLDINLSTLLIVPYASICLLPLAFINNNFWLICCGLMAGLSWLNDMVSWSEITEHTRVNKTVPSLIISFDRFGNLLGIALGYVLAFFAFGTQITDSLNNPFIPSLLVILLILITVFVVRGYYPYQFISSENRQNGSAETETKVSSPGPWRSKCLAFSALHRLTSREEEVLLLLARGRDTSHIEERLVISSHTVKAHIYNIYKKTGVHSRQGLITLIEDFDDSY